MSMREMRFFSAILVVFIFWLCSSGAARGEDAFLPVEGQLKSHSVRSGEDLYKIGLQYHMAIDHLMWANDITTVQVPAGRSLTIPSMRIIPAVLSSGLVLNLPERMLYLFENDRVVAWYPVAIGATGKWMTPVADTRIVNMAKNPTWLPPEWANQEKPVAPGPDNPLGDRWIGLAMPGYGIHATNSLLSIGMAASHGCIRMNPRDAEDLFERVKVGMPVKIVYEPVLIGQSEEDGRIYLSAYPDVYGKIPDMREFMAQKLRKYDIERLVDSSRAEAILVRKNGIPEPIVGITLTVMVNDAPVALSFPPVRIDGKLMILSEILKSLGAQINKDDNDRCLEICRDKYRFTLSCGDAARQVFIWRGRTLLPLREVVEGLGMSLEWNSREHAVNIRGAVHLEADSPAGGERKNPYEDKVRSLEERF